MVNKIEEVKIFRKACHHRKEKKCFPLTIVLHNNTQSSFLNKTNYLCYNRWIIFTHCHLILLSNTWWLEDLNSLKMFGCSIYLTKYTSTNQFGKESLRVQLQEPEENVYHRVTEKDSITTLQKSEQRKGWYLKECPNLFTAKI